MLSTFSADRAPRLPEDRLSQRLHTWSDTPQSSVLKSRCEWAAGFEDGRLRPPQNPTAHTSGLDGSLLNEAFFNDSGRDL